MGTHAEQQGREQHAGRRPERRREVPAEVARAFLRDADTAVTSLKAVVEETRRDADESGIDAAADLRRIEEETDEAWSELAEVANPFLQPSAQRTASHIETTEIDEGWGLPAKQTEIADLTAEKIEEEISDSLTEDRVDFSRLESLIHLVGHDQGAKETLLDELKNRVGIKYAKRFVDDEGYRKNLGNLQEQLRQPIFSDGPEFAIETNIEKLVLAQEMFGQDILRAAHAIELSRYTTELSINTKHTKNPVSISDPTFHPKTGECTGKITMAYIYGEEEEPELSPRIEREFHRIEEKRTGGDSEYSLVAKLQIIQLPDELNGQGIGRQETDTREAVLKECGFSKVTLKANIDIGGYAWAVKGYGWDIEVMRENSKRGKDRPAEQILEDFIGERLGVLKKLLTDSDIDITEPRIVSLLAQFDVCLQNPLAVTPQHLASIGKEGPFFIQAESGRFYEEKNYSSDIRTEDPPRPERKGALHLGKMLLIGSSWYGEKTL